MKKIAYFLSYAYSIKEGFVSGSIDRLKKELEYLSKYYYVEVYSKDSTKFFKTPQSALEIENVRFRGIPFSFIYTSGDRAVFSLLLKRFTSFLVLLQYYFLTFIIYNRKLKTIDAALVYHVSGGVCPVLCNRFFNHKMNILTRYSWSWNLFIKKTRNAIEQKLFAFFEKFVLDNSNIIFPATEDLGKCVGEIVSAASPNLVLLPNWIDCDRFKPIRLEKEYDIIAVGRLTAQKNHMLLLESVRLYEKESNQKLKVLIVGSGALRQKISDFASDNFINLTIIEKIPNDKMPYYYNKSMIYAMSSRYEGHPKALLEAMACGIPAIGTDVTGINSVIQDGERGILCKEEPHGLKDKMRLLFTNKEKRDYVGRNSRDYVLSNCSFDNVMEKLREYIDT
ncbi:glycosyltransferase family 4 protein [Candidatus Omnitrophota bacterium]